MGRGHASASIHIFKKLILVVRVGVASRLPALQVNGRFFYELQALKNSIQVSFAFAVLLTNHLVKPNGYIGSLLMTSNDPAAREKILEVALAEFMEHGLEGARMQAIADRAQCNKAMLHYYFSSKEGLYQAAIDDLCQQFEGALQAAVEGTDRLGDFLDQVASTFFAYHSKNPGFIRLLIREFARDMQTMKKVFEVNRGRVLPKNIEAMLERVADFQARGQIRCDIEPLHALMTIMGALGSSMLQARVFTTMTGADFEGFLKQRRHAVVAIMEQGLRPPLPT